MADDLMQKVVALCKRRGFIYPGSEIYGGLGGTWDYGPLGTELKRNIKNIWWKDIVQKREDIVGIDSAIMLNPKVWEASGHVEAFTDPLVECKKCHKRFRADQVKEIPKKADRDIRRKTGSNVAISMSDDIRNVLCIDGLNKHEFTEPHTFNLLVKAYLGVLEGKQSEIYLRGEITQGVHIDFKNVLDSTRVRLPFGIAQIGKAFRNEITPGNFTFRSREFEQMEIQYFVEPEEKIGEKWYEYWKKFWMSWYINLGIKKDNLRFKDHEEGQRAHYARMATDIEYNGPWGWAEFMGIHHRGDWDLSRHEQFSGQGMKYRDPESGVEFIPWDIESSAGVDRSALFFIVDAYFEKDGKVILKLDPRLAPIKVAVFPLLGNKPQLTEVAKKIYEDLKQDFMALYDGRGNIGGRYASQDEIGTPFCITVDFDCLKDKKVTVRERDTGKQERVKIVDLAEYLSGKIK